MNDSQNEKLSQVISDVSKWQINDFEILETLGTGTFGRFGKKKKIFFFFNKNVS